MIAPEAQRTVDSQATQWRAVALYFVSDIEPPLARRTDQYDCYERRLSGDLRAVRAKMAKGWLKAP